MWYGINMVVVVVIFISGFCIMLYFGGCVGKGIYFVLENSKLVGYVIGMNCGVYYIGYMFLGEVVLGREYYIIMDNFSLKSLFFGFDSVIV